MKGNSMICGKCCKHGGVCALDRGHEELHDAGGCRYSDEETIGIDEADDILRITANSLGVAGETVDWLIDECRQQLEGE